MSLQLPARPLAPAARDRITVCICTFRRPDHLVRLLDALAGQARQPFFFFDIVVVDNDRDRSGEPAVRTFQRQGRIPTVYDVEPEQNISLARNRAIRIAQGNVLAFIDDDELPHPEWLAHLYQTLNEHRADGVLAPVIPDFPDAAPAWVRRAQVFKRRRLRTGTRIDSQDARTGNLMIRRSIFVDGELWFDPRFGRTGGEDSDFFSRQFSQGRFFVWCDEAVASEGVPPERWTLAFHVKRYLRSGTLDGECMRTGRQSPLLFVKNLVILAICVLLTPVSFALPKHVRVRILQKLAYCGGVVSAYCGMSLLRERD